MTEGLPKPNDRDFDLLRAASRQRSWARVLVTAGFCLVCLFFVVLFISYLIRIRGGDELSADLSRERIVTLQNRWSQAFVERWDGYRAWLIRHGTQTESRIFDDLSALVVDSLVGSNSAQLTDDELTGFSRTFVALHVGIVRLLFVLISIIRLSIAAGFLACLSGLVAYRPYRRNDALGQMGNGRVFYSGVRAGLDEITAEGAPDIQVRGFACPQMSSAAEAKACAVWRVLQRFDADNETNLVLVQILHKNSSIAAYVAAAGEEQLLADAFQGATLLQNSAVILEAALTQHAEYVSGQISRHGAENSLSDMPALVSGEDYGVFLKRAFDSVLTDQARKVIAQLPACEIATLVLAFESGKVLAHSFEGGKWVRRSNFPHLSARAVLHSIVEYPRDYDNYSRMRIRHGLIYAARKSAFSPVRMPVNMSEDSWALRQWAEVLLACPHELSAVVDEVELVGIVRESHARWKREFFHSDDPVFETLRTKGVATSTNLLFLPVSDVVACMRRCVDSASTMRMHVLLQRVARHQARQHLLETESDSGPTLQLSFERVEPAPAEAELRKLAEAHGMVLKDVQDWIALRTVLSTYGWVASRVGDYSVPHISVIFAVFRSTQKLEGANALGLLGKEGMVPLRGSKLSEEWGGSWGDGFLRVDRSTMAETNEDYQKLLQGVEEIKVLEEDVAFSPSKVQA